MRTRCLFILLLGMAFTIGSVNLIAQNLDAIGKQKPFGVSGGVSLNQLFYAVGGIESRRLPYTYVASGNLNLSLYGWSVPFSFSVSNQNTTFQQPFNQYSLHPTYKSVTAHVGYSSVAYSPYTVNGHNFLGAAVDVAPEGRWSFSGLYGRFLKAVELDTTQGSNVAPAFKRMGYGFKTSYTDGKNTGEIALFYAKDDVNSIRPLPDSLHILPQENLVLSIGGGITIAENILLRTELAGSTLTQDTRAEREEEGSGSLPSFLYPHRVSTVFYGAHKTSLTYQQPTYTIGMAYERIAPQYRTLGAYFFNNDLENITLNASASLEEGKVNVAVSGGAQQDNLDNSKVSTLRRIVGSINVNYTPSQKLNISTSYSSFQSFTNIRSQFVDINQLTPYDNLDTLNFTQLSQNATLAAQYMLGNSTNRKQNLGLHVSYQDAADEQGGVPQNSGTQFYNANMMYSFFLVPENLTISASLNATLNEGAGLNSKTYGPILSLAKMFFDKKLRTSLSTSYNNTFTNGRRMNVIMSNRLSGAFSIKKKHNLNVTLAVVNRKNQVEEGNSSFIEFTGNLGYSYSFGLK